MEGVSSDSTMEPSEVKLYVYGFWQIYWYSVQSIMMVWYWTEMSSIYCWHLYHPVIDPWLSCDLDWPLAKYKLSMFIRLFWSYWTKYTINIYCHLCHNFIGTLAKQSICTSHMLAEAATIFATSLNLLFFLTSLYTFNERSYIQYTIMG